ncbi:ABC transporter permease [Paenibacillus sp. JX-17]|uniref:ABC transporter permease n=1 Tax=Paenibacillus lacisoli TaxID=3064525 RepID=A0ABT9CH28_9BACL|nr:ABC transporter permease [Paenibacillus sp. JX-17]MDO7906971.1 ABC transporter permease [Paenibacillus sp. JX-17]
MTTPGSFKALVRRELRNKGSWRRAGRESQGGTRMRWGVVYLISVLAVIFVGLTYSASQDQLELRDLWKILAGFPFGLFFFAFSSVKREWSNETFGWWLTLPYSRHWLISSKWAARWIQSSIVTVAVLIIGTVYAAVISLFLGGFTLADVQDCLVSGIYWTVMIILVSPLILALGILAATIRYTLLRPLLPLLMILSMGGFSLVLSSVSDSDHPVLLEWLGFGQGGWTPSAVGIVSIVAAWIATALINRLTAYLLEHKLTI